MRSGLSLVEVVVAALVIGFSALPILELMRSATVGAEVTEIEAAARALAGDVLERLAARAVQPGDMALKVAEQLQGQPMRWSQLYDDRFLKQGFPWAQLAPLLDEADARVTVKIERPCKHAVFRGDPKVALFEVTASWTDRLDHRKEVTLARIVEN